MTGIEDAIQEKLLASFEDKDEKGYETTTIGSAFFRDWLKEGGNAYTFVFHKNLRVTNMQHAELIALVSTHTFDKATKEPVRSLQFVSSHDFVQTLDALLHGVPSAPSPEDAHLTKRQKKRRLPQWTAAAAWFAETYAHMLYNTAVLDPFYGSASVYLPAHLDLNLAAICGRAGYIHSCGRNVFVRNVSKARYDHFSKAIERHLQRFPPDKGKRVFFTVYAHEEFDRPWERRKADLRDGLDDIKIHIDKSFMERKTLVEVVSELRKQFARSLEVAETDHFEKTAETRSRTMWLISDYNVQTHASNGEDIVTRGHKRYYACYDQLYDNKNPFQCFDENKPAWVEHTTIPHTLMAAMINVTRPSWARKNILLADPFVGSGTTWIEAWKYPELTVVSGDKSSLAVTAASDNAKFLGHIPETLLWMTSIIDGVAQCFQEPAQQRAMLSTLGNSTITEHVEKVKRWIKREAVSDEEAESFLGSTSNDLDRIFFYLILRTYRRHGQALERHSRDWEEQFGRSFAHEAETLNTQIKAFARLKQLPTDTALDAALCICAGRYSNSVSISVGRLNELQQVSKEHRPQIRMAEDLLRDDAAEQDNDATERDGIFDIIITDPPYGFNTDEDPQALARLYRNVVEAAVRTLKPDGQLVICLPERSTIGKDPAAFTHHRIVTHQVLSFAAKKGRAVLVPAQSIPGSRPIFHPPYYWVSERLQRSILHFKIR